MPNPLNLERHRGLKKPWYSIAMATINKASIREEIERLKYEFKQLCSAGKVPSKTQILMKSLLVVVELILAVYLEKKTRKNSKKLSILPTQTPKNETAKVNPSNGKGCKLSGEINNTCTKGTLTIARATTCDICGWQR